MISDMKCDVNKRKNQFTTKKSIHDEKTMRTYMSEMVDK